MYPIEQGISSHRHNLCVLYGMAVCACVYVCVAEGDYLGDGFNKTDAIVSSLDLNQAVTKVIPVVFPLSKEGCLLFLVKLRDTHHLIIQYCPLGLFKMFVLQQSVQYELQPYLSVYRSVRILHSTCITFNLFSS